MMQDTPDRYNTVSRALHWSVAVLIAWQLAGMALKLVLGRVPLMAFWVGTHASVGTLIFVLVIVRAGWALWQRRRRPRQQAGPLGRLATLGHSTLYLLMLVVPGTALLRLWGSGRPATLFGISVRDGTGEPIGWAVAPAELLHGWGGWLLALLIIGHVAMVLVHRMIWHNDVLARMAPSSRVKRGQPAGRDAVRS